jgi:hypothetical protein
MSYLLLKKYRQDGEKGKTRLAILRREKGHENK